MGKVSSVKLPLHQQLARGMKPSVEDGYAKGGKVKMPMGAQGPMTKGMAMNPVPGMKKGGSKKAKGGKC
jgi:hypothetical protein